MTQIGFRERLREAGLTAEEFADIVQVDPKTVQRWVAGRVPQRRHRPKIARALDTPEDALWPNDISATDAAAAEREARPSGVVIASWGWADDPGAPDPAELLTADSGPVDVIDGGGELLRDDRLIAALLEIASEHVQVRVLVDVPRRDLLPLIGASHLELRVIDSTGPCAMLRVGERMLVYPDLPRARPEELRPVLEAVSGGDGGLFARLADMFDALWGTADDPITTDAQLDEYLIDSPGIHDDDDIEPDAPASSPDTSSPSGAESNPDQDPRAALPRRWPRRPT